MLQLQSEMGHMCSHKNTQQCTEETYKNVLIYDGNAFTFLNTNCDFYHWMKFLTLPANLMAHVILILSIYSRDKYFIFDEQKNFLRWMGFLPLERLSCHFCTKRSHFYTKIKRIISGFEYNGSKILSSFFQVASSRLQTWTSASSIHKEKWTLPYRCSLPWYFAHTWHY